MAGVLVHEQSIDAMSSPEIKVDLTPSLYNIVIMYLDGKEKRDRLLQLIN